MKEYRNTPLSIEVQKYEREFTEEPTMLRILSMIKSNSFSIK